MTAKKTLTLRISSEAHAELVEAANDMMLDVSSYIRVVVFERVRSDLSKKRKADTVVSVRGNKPAVDDPHHGLADDVWEWLVANVHIVSDRRLMELEYTRAQIAAARAERSRVDAELLGIE